MQCVKSVASNGHDVVEAEEMKVFAYILLLLGSRQIKMSISSGEPVAIVIPEGKQKLTLNDG